jgi:hypothetical protein
MSPTLMRAFVITLVDVARAGHLEPKLPWLFALRGKGAQA